MSILKSLRGLSLDSRLLFCTRFLRIFAYGFVSVILALYLVSIGLSAAQMGALFSLALLGDAAVSLVITTRADRLGRRYMLFIGAVLMIAAGIVFTLTDNFVLLVLAATIGVISPSGSEVGPFLSIEQAALAQILPASQRTRIFAWYNLIGAFATALGALTGGMLVQNLQRVGFPEITSYRVNIIVYAVLGVVMAVLFGRLSGRVEVEDGTDGIRSFGLHRSYKIVVRLSALFMLDSFAGGWVVQSLLAYWFHQRFGVAPAVLGGIFFGANLLAGVSALSAAWVAERIGLVNTMVFTHLPSNILLILVPLMPTLPLAIMMLLLRFSISQMDVPTRQAFTMAVVAPDERSAAAGITGMARSLGAALAPIMAGPLLANPALMSLPFFISGGLKVVYDILLYRQFRRVQTRE